MTDVSVSVANTVAAVTVQNASALGSVSVVNNQDSSTIVIEPAQQGTVVVEAMGQASVSVSDVGVQGPPFQDGLSISLRLSEFDTEQAKAAARSSLDLQIIDLGTFE